jgi:hypothetical protein
MVGRDDPSCASLFAANAGGLADRSPAQTRLYAVGAAAVAQRAGQSPSGPTTLSVCCCVFCARVQFFSLFLGVVFWVAASFACVPPLQKRGLIMLSLLIQSCSVLAAFGPCRSSRAGLVGDAAADQRREREAGFCASAADGEASGGYQPPRHDDHDRNSGLAEIG